MLRHLHGESMKIVTIFPNGLQITRLKFLNNYHTAKKLEMIGSRQNLNRLRTAKQTNITKLPTKSNNREI